MSTYSLPFAQTLVDAADVIAHRDLTPNEAQRTVLYLSLLAAEITLKALLEKSGWSVKYLTSRGHNLGKLLTDICGCEIQRPGMKYWRGASELMSITVDRRYADATVGRLLQAEARGASKYPNEIRYGDRIYHYQPALVLKAVKLALDWARTNWSSIRKR